jgi:hypothetical protein
MATIDDALCSILTANAAVTALIGSGSAARLFPGFIPQGEAYPQVRYLMVSAPTDHHLTGTSNPRRARYQLTSWASTHAGAAALAAAVRDALNLYAGTAATIVVTNVRVADDGQDVPNAAAGNTAQRCFGRRQDFRVSYNGTSD